MHIEYHAWESPRLHRKAELKLYGHWGRPLLVFPCAGGSFHEFEDFGMIERLRGFIDEGRVKVITIGSLDNETWLDYGRHSADRAWRHEDYHNYVLEEVVPFIHNHSKGGQPIITTGCSMGGYHTINFLLRRPDVFRAGIALSGVYRLNSFIGDYMDERIYNNSPLHFLPQMGGEHLDCVRGTDITVCCGQGAWEEECLADTKHLQHLFHEKGIPAWVDLWGHDVNHDWPWWYIQLPYFLDKTLVRMG